MKYSFVSSCGGGKHKNKGSVMCFQEWCHKVIKPCLINRWTSMLQILSHLPKTTQALFSPTNEFCLFAEELLCIVYESPAEERIIPDVYNADTVAYKGRFFFFLFIPAQRGKSLSERMHSPENNIWVYITWKTTQTTNKAGRVNVKMLYFWEATIWHIMLSSGHVCLNRTQLHSFMIWAPTKATSDICCTL